MPPTTCSYTESFGSRMKATANNNVSTRLINRGIQSNINIIIREAKSLWKRDVMMSVYRKIPAKTCEPHTIKLMFVR